MHEQWKMDLESEDHRARRDMTEKSIKRSIRGESERQVTSSTTPGSVFVSDCACILGSLVAPASYLCCGLSNGSVCLLNTANLSKIYLFEVDRDARAAARADDRRGGTARGGIPQPPPQLVAVATHPIAPTGSATTTPATGQVLLCMTLDSVVCVCPMDMSTVLERKKVSRSDLAKVKPYPAMRGASVLFSSVQFNPKGNRIAAVLAMAQADGTPASAAVPSGVRFCVAVLSTSAAPSLQSQFTSERDWHTLLPPKSPSAVLAPPLELCTSGWWSAEVWACVWSNSCLQLFRASDMTLLGECRLLRHCAADAVTSATLSCPSSTDASEAVSTNIVALVLEHNVAAAFYVTSRKAGSPDSPDLKRARAETTLSLSLSLSVSPTLQTYCTEEIPVREAHLFRSFSWTLVLLLESGAMVFLDVETMRMSAHRAVNRLRAPDADRHRTGASLTLPRHFYCVVHGKPFTAAIVEHNAAVLLKS